MTSATSLSEDAASQSLAERASGEYWEALIGARSAEQLCSAWLPILCTMIPTAQCGLLLLKDSDGSFVPAAMWPEGADVGHLRGVAEETLNSRRGAASSDRPGTTQIGYPLSGGDELLGAVILDLNSATPDAVSQAMRQLHWGAGWLMELHNRRNTQQMGVRLERSAYLLDMVLTALAESDWRKTALAIVNRLAQRFACHQVQFGIEKGKTVRVEAISQSAWFDEKANLINLAARGNERGL
jgi:hypothetical protein